MMGEKEDSELEMRKIQKEFTEAFYDHSSV